MGGQTCDQTEKYSKAQKKPIYNSLSEGNESMHWKMGGNPVVFLETFK